MLREIRLKNFRNYKDFAVDFGPGLNLVTGRNGAGKTNLLEAVFLLVEGRSIKGADLKEMVKNGTPEGWVEGRMGGEVEERVVTILRREGEAEKSVFKGMGAVAFVPEDIFIVKGNPEWRRKYLDEVIKDVKPAYGEIIKEYRRILKQRNEALRMTRREINRVKEVQSWDLLLVRYGMDVVRERGAAVRLLSDMLKEEMWEWGMGEVEVKYYSNLSPEDEEYNLEKVRKMREAETRRGMTLVGPHRDEIVFYLGGRNIRREGSQGEQKMLCLACRLVQARIKEEYTSRRTLLLFDDCFSELDARNREKLAGNIRSRAQALVTSADGVQEAAAGRTIDLDSIKHGALHG
ncbi:MAG: DNA replication and repair protein RecF [Actinobacteria bacterium]|nr:DNA replication and repair protein RecF [Actinomycetota bacterium]